MTNSKLIESIVFGRLERSFVDVSMFYPFPPSCQNQSLTTARKTLEIHKKRKYSQEVLDSENDSLTPLVFTTNGGMSTETKQYYRRLCKTIT